ncbi:MAG TPA: glycoside hydrolase family 3 N-terminal domain-containing protein [Streptosporangiaceae bacterium]
MSPLRLPRSWVRIGALVVAACLVAAIAAALAGGGRPAGRRTDTAASRGGAAGPAPLTPLQLAGQRIVYSYRGLRPPASLLARIRSGEAAGVVFFSDNVSSMAQLSSVVRELDAANASPANPVRLPLLLMTDQEGGIVRRLPGAPAESEEQVGQSARPAAGAATAGAGAARTLRAAGLNVNLAPVLDVSGYSGDFIDVFGRSYGTTAGAVGPLGAEFIAAQQRAGVAATGKHFPGLGEAARRQDTDERPVTLPESLTAIRDVGEQPFRRAIRAHVALIMLSWAVYPSLAPGRPAGLSSRIVQGELRDRLGFGGVTVSDALEAGALRQFGGFGHRAELAAQAGLDLILCSHGSVAEGSQAVQGLAAGYRDGSLSHAAFSAALHRVQRLRASLSG